MASTKIDIKKIFGTELAAAKAPDHTVHFTGKPGDAKFGLGKGVQPHITAANTASLQLANLPADAALSARHKLEATIHTAGTDAHAAIDGVHADLVKRRTAIEKALKRTHEEIGKKIKSHNLDQAGIDALKKEADAVANTHLEELGKYEAHLHEVSQKVKEATKVEGKLSKLAGKDLISGAVGKGAADTVKFFDRMKGNARHCKWKSTVGALLVLAPLLHLGSRIMGSGEIDPETNEPKKVGLGVVAADLGLMAAGVYTAQHGGGANFLKGMVKS